jgi:hypothetical protein
VQLRHVPSPSRASPALLYLLYWYANKETPFRTSLLYWFAVKKETGDVVKKSGTSAVIGELVEHHTLAYVSKGEVVSKSGYLRIVSELVKHRKVKEAVVSLLVTAKQQKKNVKKKSESSLFNRERNYMSSDVPDFVL